MEYPKTENLYASDPERPGVRGPEWGFKLPAVAQIARWLVTEKVDGMNMRVNFSPYGYSDDPTPPELRFTGRTERASIPGDLLSHMQATFTTDAMMDAFEYAPEFAEDGWAWNHSVVLYGEGFGPGIQKSGSAYGGNKRFILFDILVNSPSGSWWLKWDDVADVASKLGIPTVPVIRFNATLPEIEYLVEARRSFLLDDPDHVEGVVARTDPYLFDGRGRRVMFKHKVRDLARAAAA